jgi:hypothetical protein
LKRSLPTMRVVVGDEVDVLALRLTAAEITLASVRRDPELPLPLPRRLAKRSLVLSHRGFRPARAAAGLYTVTT